MPVGPRGEKRPGDVIGCAVKVARIATGEVEDDPSDEGRRRGGKVRAERMSAERRSEIARMGAEARWRRESAE